MLRPPHFLLLLSLLLLPCTALHCIQCSSNYEQDCRDPVASLKFLYPCLDHWNTSSCVKTVSNQVVIRNCSVGPIRDGCFTTQPSRKQVCSCDQSGCNTGSDLTSPSHRVTLAVLVIAV